MQAAYSSLITPNLQNMCLMRLWSKSILQVFLGIVSKELLDYSGVNDYNIAVCKPGSKNGKTTKSSKDLQTPKRSFYDL